MLILVVASAGAGAAISRLREKALADPVPAAPAATPVICPCRQDGLRELEFRLAAELAARVYTPDRYTTLPGDDWAGREKLALDHAKLIHQLAGILQGGK
jgi:hypothetical protein